METTNAKELSIVVVGAGAIGGIVAGFIKQANYNVEIVCKYADYAEKIRTKGIQIIGARGNHTILMPAVAKVSQLSGKYDIVLMAVKIPDLEQATADFLPFLNKDSVVVTLENGIIEEKMAEWVGIERTIGAVTGWGATMLENGVLDMTSSGHFTIGTLNNYKNPKIHAVQEILSSVVPTFISENIIGSLYSKLIINSCITSLGAVCGLYLGEMLKIKKVRKIFIEIMKEAVTVANAVGIKIEPYDNKIDYYSFIKAELKAHLLIRIIGFKYKRLKSSALQSLERGKKSEIHFLSGYIVEKGKESGIPTPINSKVVEIVESIEAGSKKIEYENFSESEFDRFN
jgi:2-dehydropantoate 2-reductase